MTGVSAAVFTAAAALASLALVALEALIPGVSLVGFGGLILMGIGLYICWDAFGAACACVVGLVWLAAAAAVMRLVYRSAKSGKLSKSGVFLKTESAPTVRTDSPAEKVTVGMEGVAKTALRPAGIAEFHGERVHVSAENGFIDAGSSVIVVRTEGAFITVAPDGKESAPEI